MIKQKSCEAAYFEISAPVVLIEQSNVNGTITSRINTSFDYAEVTILESLFGGLTLRSVAEIEVDTYGTISDSQFRSPTEGISIRVLCQS